jgi:hypothetical protein
LGLRKMMFGSSSLLIALLTFGRFRPFTSVILPSLAGLSLNARLGVQGQERPRTHLASPFRV